MAPKLELLDVEIDSGTRIDVAALPNLRDLSAYWSQVEQTISAGASIRHLAVGSYAPDDVTPLTGLRNLSSLSMKDRPKLRSLAGLSEFPLLDHLGIFLAARLEDISDLRGRDLVRTLELQSCRKLTSVSDLAGCTGLRKLNLAEGGDLESAAPLGHLVELEELYLYGTTTFIDADLSPLAGLPRLNEFRMQNRRHYRPTVKQMRDSLSTS